MNKKLSKLNKLLGLLIAGSVITVLVGLAAYISPIWIKLLIPGGSVGQGIAFSYVSAPLLFYYGANEFSDLPTEFKVAEIFFPFALIGVIISIIRIVQSRRFLKRNPSGLNYVRRAQYQSFGLQLAALALLVISLSTFTSKAVKDLDEAEVDSGKLFQQLGSSISNIKNSGNRQVRSINTHLNTLNNLFPSGNNPISSRNNPFPSNNNPFPSNNNPFSSNNNNPFSSNNNPIPSKNNPFSSNNNPFSSNSNNPFSLNNNPFPSNNNPFPTNNNPFPSNNNPFSSNTNNNPFPSNNNPFSSNNNPFPSNNNVFPTNNNPFPSDNNPSPSNNNPLSTNHTSFTSNSHSILDNNPFSSINNPFPSGNNIFPSDNNSFPSANSPSNSLSSNSKLSPFNKPFLPGGSLLSNKVHVGSSLGFSFYLGWLTFILEILVVVFHIFVYRNVDKNLSNNENDNATLLT